MINSAITSFWVYSKISTPQLTPPIRARHVDDSFSLSHPVSDSTLEELSTCSHILRADPACSQIPDYLESMKKPSTTLFLDGRTARVGKILAKNYSEEGDKKQLRELWRLWNFGVGLQTDVADVEGVNFSRRGWAKLWAFIEKEAKVCCLHQRQDFGVLTSRVKT